MSLRIHNIASSWPSSFVSLTSPNFSKRTRSHHSTPSLIPIPQTLLYNEFISPSSSSTRSTSTSPSFGSSDILDCPNAMRWIVQPNRHYFFHKWRTIPLHSFRTIKITIVHSYFNPGTLSRKANNPTIFFSLNKRPHLGDPPSEFREERKLSSHD